MNGLDVILGLVFGIGFLLFFGLGVAAIREEEFEGMFFSWFLAGLCVFFGCLCFLVLDRGSGSTIGEITSIDKNFYGTTALYIKTSENSQEEYCIEDEKVVEVAKELIGKKVKISYGERVGLYSTGKCNQAPVEEIVEVGEE